MASNSFVKMTHNSKAVESAQRMLRLVIISLVFLILAANCHAKNNCPWLNEATAGGLLGGDAVGDFTASSAGQPAVCTFTQTGANFTRTLRITVEVTPDTHARVQSAAQPCGKNAAPIQAIGNEASMCTIENRSAAPGQLVVGRVRDQLFTITFTTTLKDDPILTRAALKDKAYTAAEQVAGNLF
jgi:hypothetical protein